MQHGLEGIQGEMVICATLSGLTRSLTAKISDHEAGRLSLLLPRATSMS